MGKFNYCAFIVEKSCFHYMIQKVCLCIHVIPIYMCRPHIALILFDAFRWPIEIVKHNIFEVEDFSLFTKGATTCVILSQQSFEVKGCASLCPYPILMDCASLCSYGNIQGNCIGMGSILPPLPDNLFLECILRVILEGTSNEVTAQLNELCLVNTNGSETIKNHPYWLV